MMLPLSPHGRFLCLTLLWAALLIAPFLILALWAGASSGDLTRLGAWRDRDFYWTRPQPLVTVSANREAAGRADILVLGDSFSMGNVWQSELRRQTGRLTESFGFDQPGALPRFVAAAVSPGHRRSSLVIIETVERDFLRWFETPPPETATAPLPFDNPAGQTHAMPLTGAWHLDGRHLLRVAAQSIRLARQPRSPLADPEVMNVPLTSAGLFSNARADRLLYYRADDAKSTWTDARIDQAIDHLVAIERRLARAGVRLLVVVVPDKSSVYRPFIRGAESAAESLDLPARLARRGVPSLDLLAPMRAAVLTVPDLYMPNDTHLSTAGFLLVAGEIGHRIVADLASASASAPSPTGSPSPGAVGPARP